MDKVTRQESSIPTQTRVSIVTLAELDLYWFKEGYSIRTMSQLLSWSLDLLRDILEANGKVSGEFDTVVKAHQYLEARSLYQRGLKSRSFKKIGAALRFESLREEGKDPKRVAPAQHSMLHRSTSVEPLEGIVDAGNSITSDEEWEEIQRRIKEEDEKDLKEAKEKAMKIAKGAGLLVSDPEAEGPEKLSQEDARARYFKKQREEKEALEGAIKEDKGDQGIPRVPPIPAVKEGMSDEKWEAKCVEIKERDQAQMELEKSAEISEDDIVKE